MTKTSRLLATTLATSLLAGAAAQSTAPSQPQETVRLETCVTLVQESLGGETTHLEFESREGVPVYEFIVQSEAGSTYYVGCDATTGLLEAV